MLTTEDQLAGYTIYDILLPILGFETEMDENSVIYELYREVMEIEGISIEDFKNHNKR